MGQVVAMVGKKLRAKPLFAKAAAIQERYTCDGGNFLAAIISHYAFLSLFPLILVLVSVIGFFLARDPAAQLKLTFKIAEFFPGLSEAAGNNIRALVKSRAGVGLFGLFALMWTGIAGVQAAEFAMGIIFRVDRRVSFLRKKVEAFIRMIGLGSVAITSIGLATAVGAVRAQGFQGVMLKILAISITFLLDLALFLVAYRVLTPGPGPTYRQLWPGALWAAAGWTALKVGGGWYVRRTVEGASAAFGTFATVVGIIALLYLVCRLFIYGAEINAARLEKESPTPEPEPREGLAGMLSGKRQAKRPSSPVEKSGVEGVRGG